MKSWNESGDACDDVDLVDGRHPADEIACFGRFAVPLRSYSYRTAANIIALMAECTNGN